MSELTDLPDVPEGTPIRVSEWLASPIVLALVGAGVAAATLLNPARQPLSAWSVVVVVASFGLIGMSIKVAIVGYLAYRDLTVAATARYRWLVAIATGVAGLVLTSVWATYGPIFLAWFGFLLGSLGTRLTDSFARLGKRAIGRLTVVAIVVAIVGVLAHPLAYGIANVPSVVVCYLLVIAGCALLGLSVQSRSRIPA